MPTQNSSMLSELQSQETADAMWSGNSKSALQETVQYGVNSLNSAQGQTYWCHCHAVLRHTVFVP